MCQLYPLHGRIQGGAEGAYASLFWEKYWFFMQFIWATAENFTQFRLYFHSMPLLFQRPGFHFNKTLVFSVYAADKVWQFPSKLTWNELKIL
jgi:hypothetical protein